MVIDGARGVFLARGGHARFWMHAVVLWTMGDLHLPEQRVALHKRVQ